VPEGRFVCTVLDNEAPYGNVHKVPYVLRVHIENLKEDILIGYPMYVRGVSRLLGMRGRGTNPIQNDLRKHLGLFTQECVENVWKV